MPLLQQVILIADQGIRVLTAGQGKPINDMPQHNRNLPGCGIINIGAVVALVRSVCRSPALDFSGVSE